MRNKNQTECHIGNLFSVVESFQPLTSYLNKMCIIQTMGLGNVVIAIIILLKNMFSFIFLLVD